MATDGTNCVERSVGRLTGRELLAELDDRSKVACVFSEKDLNILITSLVYVPYAATQPGHQALLDGLRQLKKEAYD